MTIVQGVARYKRVVAAGGTELVELRLGALATAGVQCPGRPEQAAKNSFLGRG